MKTTPLFDLMRVLNAESAKASKSYCAAIERFAREAALRAPEKTEEILSAANRLTRAVALVHAEAQRVLDNGGMALASEQSLLRHMIRLSCITGMPSGALGAADIRGLYLGWDGVLKHCQRAELDLIKALVVSEPPSSSQMGDKSKAA